MKVHQKFESRGVVFLGMTSQPADQIPDMRAFLDDAGVTWPSVYGAMESMQAWGVTAIPAVWVIGPDGKVVWNSGERTKIEDAIEEALKDVR